MLTGLDRLIDDVAALQSKLILLVGPPRAGKTRLLTEVARRHHAAVLNVGGELGRRLAALPQRKRPLQANVVMRQLADSYAKDDLLLLDNIELLFDASLHLDPLDVLKRHARARRVVAVWPGEFRDSRLRYGAVGHPEYRDYALDGVFLFELATTE